MVQNALAALPYLPQPETVNGKLNSSVTFKTTALHAIPSYAIRLAEVFQEEGIDPRETTLKTLVIGADRILTNSAVK